LIPWRIHYDNGATFSSAEGSWDEAPADGVLFVVWWEGETRHVHSGHDFYFSHDGVLADTDDLGPLLRKLGLVKFGRWSSHRAMERASQQVNEMPCPH